ncbi:MAG: hypothetical protein V3W50_08625 [Thermoanaerobaculia bacterium]
MKARHYLAIALALACLVIGACQSPEPQTATSARVENAALNIAITDLPESFVLETNQDTTLRFTTAGGEDDGLLWFEVGPLSSSPINLVEEVKARRTAFEETTGGRYFGNRELATPHGPAYTARGAIETSDGVVEEIWIYTIHPAEYRLVTLVYRYPSAEDSADRAAQLMSILGEVESVEASTEEVDETTPESSSG